MICYGSASFLFITLYLEEEVAGEDRLSSLLEGRFQQDAPTVGKFLSICRCRMSNMQMDLGKYTFILIMQYFIIIKLPLDNSLACCYLCAADSL